MRHEASPRSSAGVDNGGRIERCVGEPAPLQSRAAFLAYWRWELVTNLNRGLCERGKAQHGANPETQEACRIAWEEFRAREVTLGEIFDFLREQHRKAPFLFLNGNTFAEIGRNIAKAIFADVHPTRLKIAASSVAHYIAGVLEMDKAAMQNVLESMVQNESFAIGDRVQSLKGSLHGSVKTILPDGRLVVKVDGSSSTVTGLPDTFSRESAP